jgi:DNA-binding MarR family transcriptional regulator
MSKPDSGTSGPLRRWEDVYETNAGLRATVESIPGIGAALGALLSGDRRAWFEERLRLFLEDLRSEVADIVRKSGLDEQVIQSQGYAHLMLLAMEAAVRSRSDKKRRLYARLMARRASLDRPSDEERAEEVMQSLADLTMTEISVLRAIADNPNIVGIDPDSLRAMTGLTGDESLAYCARLQRTGFIMIRGAPYDITTVSMTPGPIRVYAMPLLTHLARLVGEE